MHNAHVHDLPLPFEQLAPASHVKVRSSVVKNKQKQKGAAATVRCLFVVVGVGGW
jgi:hypothetical protein